METKTKLSIIAGIPFWGSLVWAWISYGWELPIIILLVVIGISIQRSANDILDND